MTASLDHVAERATKAALDAGTGTRVESVRPLAGGHSGLTLRADLVDADGASTPIVIKAAPPGRAAVGRHDVLRQARLYRIVGGQQEVGVPTVLFTDAADPPMFGMTLIPGEAVEPILDDAGRHLGADVVRARSLSAADMLAALHGVDPTGLDEPRSIRDELNRWARTLDAVDPELVAGGDELLCRLAAELPSEREPAVVHGDYRLGNILCEGRELRGVIDWEIWTVADPRLDLGWFLVHFDATEYPGVGRHVPGLPSPSDVRARYERTSGVAIADWSWFDAFGRFKLAAIMAHNLRRHRDGRHVDPFQERLPPTISHLIESGLDRLV